MAARFDASTDAYTATAGLPTGTAYSFTCWSYLTTDRNIESFPVAFSDGAAFLFVGTDATGTALTIFDGVGQIDSGASMTVGAWSRIGVTTNAGSVVFYTGAATGALASTSGTLSPPGPPTSLTVGSDEFDEWFNGRIAALKVWSAALTATEITAELQQYVPIRRTNLLRDHPFVGAGTTDYSGNGNSLTAGSTATTTEDGPPIPWTVAPAVQPSTAPRRAANF